MPEVAITAINPLAEICVYILSWHLGGLSEPPKVSFDHALKPFKCPVAPQLYVVALQGIHVNHSNDVANPGDRFAIDVADSPWSAKVYEYLRSGNNVQIATAANQGMITMVFAQQHLTHAIGNIDTIKSYVDDERGGISIRMNVHKIGVVFVNAHLKEGVDMRKNRLNDIKRIASGHKFAKQPRNHQKIDTHHCVFWIGGLNFDLRGAKTTTELHELVKRKRQKELYELDALSHEHRTGKLFPGMQEAIIEFLPTYKYVRGTNKYDLETRPTWPDRILYKYNKTPTETTFPLHLVKVQHLSYRSHVEFIASDHKPISAEFSFKVQERAKQMAYFTDADAEPRVVDKDVDDVMKMMLGVGIALLICGSAYYLSYMR